MDITGSESLTESGGSSTNSSTESVNGLKFGKKVYFEDSGKIGCSSGSGKKGKNGNGIEGSQTSRCQVEGCNVDLSDGKAYYSRHKVCGMHSKSSKVVVGGIQQRFCQQCSRFHQLTEFDQGKRSCRRRLAGHNERRRKPPSSSLMSPRFTMLSSSLFEKSERGVMLDFSAPTTGPLSEHGPGNASTDSSWTSFSSGETGFSNPGLLQGEYFTTDSTCAAALSLLSNTLWGTRRTSDLVVNDLTNVVEVDPSISLQAASNGAENNIHYPNTSWGFKGSLHDTSSSSSPALGLGQIPQFSQSINQVANGMELSGLNRNNYMELEQSRAYDSIQHINWSL